MSHKTHIKTAIMNRFFKKMFFAGLLYILILTVGLAAAQYVLGSRIWQMNDPFYWQLHWIQDNQGLFVFLLFITGLLLIGIVYWIKLLNYFQEVMEAMELLSGEEQTIHLSRELAEAEQHMNQVQQEIWRNERLAKEAEQRKNDLVVYLAHDLKTPLTSVIGYLSLLQEEQQISPQLREKYLGISLDKARRLEELINEFFEITRFNLTHLELERTTLSLKRMLEQILFEFQPMMAEKKLDCKLETEPADMKLECDADKMQRVFDNLLRNAVLYSTEGGRIRIRSWIYKDNIRISVENTGMAIPKEKLSRIFEQFYRLDGARSSGNGGAGLGLAIAREIVERHNGNIWAESRDGKTIFTIELPQVYE